ncbi:hypothetical protein BS50DRAFT_7727 [Corynespora cassiicola Philippines]|uniref:Uncharacterized protein n=1 Tax=Corynespora cassiicola Philippines TaxID=1448308 RepID=A0A2T2P8W1_CORCC|nr:hypothetical protein BS50DRAFT_7727 [Corynespora cassiicola Philippines]
MATPASPPLPYHSPSSYAEVRGRRSSSRKSFTTPLIIPSTSVIESPRPVCPVDSDAFSFDAAYLKEWLIAQDLWTRLPCQLQAALAMMQHAGAAVLTGYQRLERHTQQLDSGSPNHKLEEDEFLVQLDPLPSPKLRTMSTASSSFNSDLASSVFSNSPVSLPSYSPMTQSQTLSPISPICLTPVDDKRSQSRDRSFSTPLEPHDAYYATELSHLRTEALPRLRHAGHKVDMEWYDAKRTGSISPTDFGDFEIWWADKKRTIIQLSEKGKRLSLAIGLSPTGLGWTAP